MSDDQHTLVLLQHRSMERDDSDWVLIHTTCTEGPADCFVHLHLIELGVDTALCGVWVEDRLPPGSYDVQAWSSRYDVPGEPVEYDAGVEILEPEEYSLEGDDMSAPLMFRGDEVPAHRHWWRRVETAQIRGDLL